MKAVNVKELKHLYNVVVFSTMGERPDQHKLSNGDLDGDTYMVVWDYDLVKDFKSHEPSGNVKESSKTIKSDKPNKIKATFVNGQTNNGIIILKPSI